VLFFGECFAIILAKPFKIKENNDGKFNQMCCRDFGNILCEKPNVKMDKLHKPGGGGVLEWKVVNG
jgi:hypothetical protein